MSFQYYYTLSHESLLDWLGPPEISSSTLQKLEKMFSEQTKTFHYDLKTVLQALARLSVELPPNHPDLPIIQALYIKFSFFNGNYQLVARFQGKRADIQSFCFASKVILNENIDLAYETNHLFTMLSKCENHSEISHACFILLIILTLKGYFQSARNVLYLCLDKMNLLESKYRKSQTHSDHLYQFSWLFLLSYTDPSSDIIEEIFEAILKKSRSRDPIMSLLSLGTQLLVGHKENIHEIYQVFEDAKEWSFILALIEVQFYRMLVVYPIYTRQRALPQLAYPDFFSTIIKINFAMVAWIYGLRSINVDELLYQSLEKSRQLLLYYPLIKGYINFAMYLTCSNERNATLTNNSEHRMNNTIAEIVDIKKILFGMEETKENEEFSEFLKYLFNYYQWLKIGVINQTVTFKFTYESESLIANFLLLNGAISSTDKNTIAHMLKLFRKSYLYFSSSLMRRYYLFFAIELKLKELIGTSSLDNSKLERFQNYIQFLTTEVQNNTEDDILIIVLEVFQIIRLYKKYETWTKHVDRVKQYLSQYDFIWVFKDILDYLMSIGKNDMPIVPFLNPFKTQLYNWLHFLQMWTFLSFFENSLPTYFLITPPWKTLEPLEDNDKDETEEFDLVYEFTYG